MRTWIAALTVAFPFAIAAPAMAQSGPSVDQIIKSLTPNGDPSRAGTRGIRLSAPSEMRQTGQQPMPVSMPAAPNARAAATPVKPAKASAEVAAPSINLTVNFALGSAELTPQATEVLDKLGTALASETLSAYRFRIEGHTDTIGTRDYNKSLSDLRAEAVVTYIREKYHVADTRMEPVGMGATRLLVQTADQVDEPRNRRVQITNIGS